MMPYLKGGDQEKVFLLSYGLSLGLTNKLRIVPATAQLGPRLSLATMGAIKLRFILVNKVILNMHIMRRGISTAAPYSVVYHAII